MPDALLIIEFPSADEGAHAAGFVPKDGPLPNNGADQVLYSDDQTGEPKLDPDLLPLLRAPWP
jgi:hypothetical protein